MFTGLVADLGPVTGAERSAEGVRLTVGTGSRTSLLKGTRSRSTASA